MAPKTLKRHGISPPVTSPHFDSVCVWLGLLGVCRRSRAPLPSVCTLTTALWWTGEIPSVLDRAVTWVPGKERHGMISPATKALLWPLCNCGHQAPLMHPQVRNHRWSHADITLSHTHADVCRYHIESVQNCNIPYTSLSSLAFSSLLRVPVLKQMSPSRNTASAHIWYGTGFCATRSLKEGPSSGSMQRKGKAVFSKKLK